MKILVTGAAGFIGANFVNLYEGEKAELITIDRMDPQSNLVDVNYPADLSIVAGWDSSPSITHILHLAAQTHVDRSIADSSPFIHSNVVATHTLLEFARHCPKLEKFIYVSTDEVYGPTDGLKFIESDRLLPTSPYAASKAAGELLCQSFQRTHGLPLIITRSTNNYGRWQNEEKLIPTICKCIAEGRDIPIYGTGTNVRDWLHVEDHCLALWDILNRGTVGEIYNIGADHPMTNNDLVKAILAMTSSSSKIVYVEDRKAHDQRYAVDTYKIYRELAWKPRIAFEKALPNVVSWYLQKFSHK